MTTCPECNSDDIEEEDDMMTNLITLGIPIAMNTSYKCNKCGHEWDD